MHLHVREDATTINGFKTFEQRELFRKLILVSGIGPKGALAILASGNQLMSFQQLNEKMKHF